MLGCTCFLIGDLSPTNVDKARQLPCRRVCSGRVGVWANLLVTELDNSVPAHHTITRRQFPGLAA